MKTIETRVYTNVILTVIALLLAAIALRPVLDVATTAYAQRERGFETETTAASDESYGETSVLYAQANALKEVAASIREMAKAMEATSEHAAASAEAQQAIAEAIRSLGQL